MTLGQIDTFLFLRGDFLKDDEMFVRIERIIGLG